MNGTADGTTAPGTGPDPTGPLTVKQAAARLGIGERAIRKRIRAGTLMAQHIEGQWRVWPDAVAARGPSGTAEQGRRAMEPRNRAVEPGPEPGAAVAIVEGIVAPLVAELAAARTTIERLATENGMLRERLRAIDADTQERNRAVDRMARTDAQNTMDRVRFAQNVHAAAPVAPDPEPVPAPTGRPTPRGSSVRARVWRWLRS